MFISRPSVICPFGGTQELFSALLRGERKFSQRELFKKKLLVGEISQPLPEFSSKTSEIYKTRTNQILLAALLGLRHEIDEVLRRYGKGRVGVVIGTTTAGVEENYAAFLPSTSEQNFAAKNKTSEFNALQDARYQAIQNFATPESVGTRADTTEHQAAQSVKFNPAKFMIERNLLANPAEFAREFLDLSNVALGVSTACTSGIKAFETAQNLLNLDLADAVICGGVDSLNSLTLLGFNSLGVLSEQPCKPFDTARAGINIGEGAAIFVMTRERVQPFYLRAVGSNTDAYHITQPDPQANMQIALIRQLLSEANLNEVDFISLHGTGTLANDAMEARAVAKTLPNTLCSGIKANIGHTLGAAGAIEAATCLCAIEHGVVPMQILQEFDPNLDRLNLADQNVSCAVKNCLNLSFAFGGDNAGMILGASDE